MGVAQMRGHTCPALSTVLVDALLYLGGGGAAQEPPPGEARMLPPVFYSSHFTWRNCDFPRFISLQL